jgi:hypothetical protein
MLCLPSSLNELLLLFARQPPWAAAARAATRPRHRLLDAHDFGETPMLLLPQHARTIVSRLTQRPKPGALPQQATVTLPPPHHPQKCESRGSVRRQLIVARVLHEVAMFLSPDVSDVQGDGRWPDLADAAADRLRDAGRREALRGLSSRSRAPVLQRGGLVGR